MDKAQLMKGILECCILKIIERKETYGYEIVMQLNDYGISDVKEGTIYPLLLRMEKKQLIVAFFKESPLGPKRKYYSLTSKGKKYVDNFYHQWMKIADSVDRIFKQEDV